MVIVYLHWLIAVNMGVYTILSMVIWWQLSLFPIIYEFYATSILNSQNWLWNRRALFKNYHTSKRHHWRHPWFPCPYPRRTVKELSFECGAGEAFEFDFDKYCLAFHNFPLKVGSSLKTAIEIEKLMKNHEKSMTYYNMVKGFLLRNDWRWDSSCPFQPWHGLSLSNKDR